MPKMTPSEALVETMVAEGVQNVFGIVGSAFMDALDLFPAAGIRFIPVAHEQAALEGFESRLKAICAGESEFVLEAGGHEPAPQDVQSELARAHANGGENGAH